MVIARRTASLTWPLAALLCASCLPPPAQVIVFVDAEAAVRSDARYDHVRIQVIGRDASGGRATELDEEVRPGSGGIPWPFRVVLTPRGGDATRTYEVRATAEDSRDVPFVETRAISGYAPRETRALPLLLTASCVDFPECGAAETCLDRGCVDAIVLVEDLPPIAMFQRDAGLDARSGSLDAGADATSEDTGVLDSGPVDTGTATPIDAGPLDTGPLDAGPLDAGPVDTGPMDLDAAAPDAAARPAFSFGSVLRVLAGGAGELQGSSVCTDDDGAFFAARAVGPGTVTLSSGDVFGASPGAGSLACRTDGGRVLVGNAASFGAPLYARSAMWGIIQEFTASRSGQQFGFSAGLGGTFAVVGAPTGDINGLAYVFSVGADAPVVTLLPSAAALPPGDRFGGAVAMSGDGDYVAVGAPLDGEGAVYIFSTGGDWSGEIAEIIIPAPPGAVTFGLSVALDATGSTLVVGAPSEAGGTGAAYVYTRDSIGWAPLGSLRASNPGAGDEFGVSVAVSDDGRVIAVGAPGEDSTPLGVRSVVDEAAPGSGAVYVFTDLGPPNFLKVDEPSVGAALGVSVVLSRDGLVVIAGAPTFGGDQGAVFSFR